MADIIDLDFYRKFRIVLPMRPSKLAKSPSFILPHAHTKPFRRKHRLNLDPKHTQKE